MVSKRCPILYSLVACGLLSTLAVQSGYGFRTPEKFTTETKKILELWKQKIDMNVDFQLRKLGIVHGRSTSNNATKCFGPLGCLEITEDWYGITRPVNELPQDREVINTQLYLYKREAPKERYPLNISDPEAMKTIGYDASKPTKIIIHGFIDTGFVPWVLEMSEALLDNGDFNVVFVDWGGGSAALYSQAAANTRLVGLEVAYFIENAIKVYDAKLEDFHLIGHSLGCHISGYAGERLKVLGLGVLGRISAMDPAEPLFQSMPEFVRLDPDDAEFVDVIHTDAKSILMFGYGMEQPVGHVDFYPNGGIDQPGCSLLDLPVDMNSMVDPDRTTDSVSRHLVACSHNRALQLYIQSLKVDEECTMVGHECASYEEFQLGRCFECGTQTQHCAPMGYRSIEYKRMIQKYNRRNVKFYLNTAKGPKAFCQFHYLLEVNLASPPVAERWVQGYLKANLYGSQSEVLEHRLTPDRTELEHGEKYSFALNLPRALGSLERLELGWQYQSQLLNPLTYCLWSCNRGIHVEKLTLRREQLGQSGNQANVVHGRRDPLSARHDILQESLRFVHGQQRNFLMAFSQNLGQVRIVNLFWEYDHELDPLNLTKVCVLLCSDHIFVRNITVAKIHTSPINLVEGIKLPPRDDRTVICGGSKQKDYSEIPSGEWKLFYKHCSNS